MIEAGALDEVRRLAALGLDPGLPAMKALATPELLRHLAGEIPLEAALLAAKQATRRYAKRQLTWQRNKMHAWNRVLAQDSECFHDKIFPEIRQFLLTLED
jgi:tRNA dimethylallyltransferase